MRHPVQGKRRTFSAALFAGFVCLGGAAQTAEVAGFQTLMKQGFELHQHARFAEAIPVLEQARKLEPSDYFANLLLGIDLLRIGKESEAVPRLQLAARLKPAEEIPEDYLGEAEARLGRYAPAAEAYKEAVARGHDSEESLAAWGGFAVERFRQVGEGLRSTSAGVAMIRRLQQAAARPPETLKCEAAIPSLERRLAASPSGRDGVGARLETAYSLSICYALEAGKAAEQLQRSAKDMAALDRLRGDVLLRLKDDPQAAQEEYRKAIALRPGDPALLERLAAAQLTAGDTEGARQSATAALSVDPHRVDALRTLISLAMSNRDYQQALPWLRHLVNQAPGNIAAQVELGRALAQTGNGAEALKYLASALRAGYPDEKGSLHALEARVLREMGREDEAAKASTEARRLSDAFQARNKGAAGEKENADQ